MLNNTERQVLVALFRMARNNRHATAIRLANAVGLAPDEVRSALAALEAKGFADAERVRLSLNGLVVATSLSTSAEVRRVRSARSVVGRAA
jgi:predicted ArsR family transcriptional regulator